MFCFRKNWAPRISLRILHHLNNDRAIRSNLSLGERISTSVAGAWFNFKIGFNLFGIEIVYPLQFQYD